MLGSAHLERSARRIDRQAIGQRRAGVRVKRRGPGGDVQVAAGGELRRATQRQSAAIADRPSGDERAAGVQRAAVGEPAVHREGAADADRHRTRVRQRPGSGKRLPARDRHAPLIEVQRVDLREIRCRAVQNHVGLVGQDIRADIEVDRRAVEGAPGSTGKECAARMSRRLRREVD